MADTRTTQIAALRRAIDCLPERTRHAMLAGIANNTIVVGAYTMGDGICPMLAAHRAGGRTNFVAFARAWDEYAFRGVRKRRRRPRLATVSELTTLKAHIEASLLAEDRTDLGAAVAEHRGLVATRSAERARDEQRRRDAARAELERSAESDLSAENQRIQSPHDTVPAAASTPRRSDRVRPGDPDRSGELKHRHGWRWMRIMRSYDEYEQAMAALDEDAVERELTHSRD